MRHFRSGRRGRRLAALGCALALAAPPAVQGRAPEALTYRNPLPVRLASGEPAQNCADPAVLRDPRAPEPTWYLFCTSDPVSKREIDTRGEKSGWRFRLMPVYRSTDLVHWDFAADAFSERPAGLADPASGLWAPEPVYLNGRYYLYFTVTDVVDAHSPEPGCAADSAIGVAVADGPAGPWTASRTPVVGPRRAGPGCSFHWTYDPEVVVDGERKYLYYGSYGGGLWVQQLRDDGMAVQGEPVRVGFDGRYEGPEVVRHGPWWYLFASATNCCNGPLTGYAVFVGRARTPLGPFLDRLGNDMAAGRAGGTPVMLQNGNRWVGPGHNTVFQDGAGQWWTIYHAIDQAEPFFSARDQLTRRLALLDRIDWVGGWPVTGGGQAPSDRPMAAPAVAAPADAARRDGAAGAGNSDARAGAAAASDAQAGAAGTSGVSAGRAVAAGGRPGPAARRLWSDGLRGPRLAPRWRWLRPPAAKDWSLGAGGLLLATQAGDLYADTDNAGVLQAPLPGGDYRIEVRLRLDAPEDCCAQPVQAGLVVMRDDDNYVKLVELARGGLRQVEFAKEEAPVAPDYPRYGNTLAGTPGRNTWLRLDVHRTPGGERYTAYSSQDGRTWVGGGAWNHRLGNARLGLVAMGGAGRLASFSRVTVWSLSPESNAMRTAREKPLPPGEADR